MTKERFIRGLFVIKERLIRGLFMTKDRLTLLPTTVWESK